MNRIPYIAVVGGMNLDIQGKSFEAFKAGDSNPGSLRLLPGGVGRNIAENLVRLGCRVELITVLGDDEASDILSKSCDSIGIGLHGTLKLPGIPASRYVCLLDSDGSLAGAVAAMDSMDLLSPERLERSAALLDSADLVIVDANIPEVSINWLARRYPRGTRRPLLVFDPVSARKAAKGRSSLASFAFAKPNRAEAAILAGLEAGIQDEGTRSYSPTPQELARLLRAQGLIEAFISLAAEGLFAEGPGPADGSADIPERWVARLPSRPGHGLERVNASGAGDAACAAIAWGLLAGKGLGERCALALSAAMLAAASESPVNPDIGADLLIETAKGIELERIS